MFVNFEYVYDLSLITHSYYNYYYYFILFCFALLYFLFYFNSVIKLQLSQPMGFTFFFWIVLPIPPGEYVSQQLHSF